MEEADHQATIALLRHIAQKRERQVPAPELHRNNHGLNDVRFTPESGPVQCSSLCLLWAKSGHGHDHERSGSKAAVRGKITLISVNARLRLDLD